MPAWITHLVTANKVFEKLNVEDKNSFLFGNIMPDILNNHIVKNTKEHKNYETTHFSKSIIINDIEHEIPNIDNFFKEYRYKMKNPIILGYYMHLLTDYYWNYTSFKNFFKGNNGLVEVKFVNGDVNIYKKEDIAKIKQDDFKIFTRISKIKL